MVLADQLVERAGAQPVGERLMGAPARRAGRQLPPLEQIAHPPITTASLSPARSISSRQGGRNLLSSLVS